MTLMEEAGFDALITIDQGIPHQQNPSRSAVAVVVLQAHSNRLEHTAPLIRDSVEKVRAAQPGEVTYLL